MIEQFLQHSGAQFPLICGAMYPCSNPELLAAVAACALAVVLGLRSGIPMLSVSRQDTAYVVDRSSGRARTSKAT